MTSAIPKTFGDFAGAPQGLGNWGTGRRLVVVRPRFGLADTGMRAEARAAWDGLRRGG
jgi:hypothetical protein